MVDPIEPRLTAHRLVDGRFVRHAGGAGDDVLVTTEPVPVTLAPADLVH